MDKPLTLYGPRGEKLAFGARNNDLIASSTQSGNRKQIPLLDHDIHRNVSNLGRRTMMGLGRYIFCNFPDVRGALREMADYAGDIFTPVFLGKNAAFSELARPYIEANDKVCDIAGPPYNMRLYRRNLVTAVKRDGDALTILLKRKINGRWQPRLQLVPAHRVGCRSDQRIVEGGKWDGARIIDGVIVDDYGAALAYRALIGENPFDFTQFRDIDATDAFLSFDPDFVGQVRGFSSIGASAFPWQDVHEWRKFELLAEKVNAAIALIEDNPGGTALDTARHALGASSDAGQSQSPAGISYETHDVDGVQVRYFRANSGSGLKAHINDRPTANQQNFEARIIRSNFYGMDWSVDFGLDPTHVAGAPMRVVIERINRSIGASQDVILEPAQTRYHGFRLGVAMDEGDLPFDPEWHKWRWQPGPQLSADKKYDSEIDQAESEIGFQTDQLACGKRGTNYTENYRQKDEEADRKLTIAKKHADKYGISIQEAFNIVWGRKPNGLTGKGDAEKPGKPKTQEDED